MRLFRQPRSPLHPAVMTLGNFDGVHEGHQALLQRVVEQARTLGAPSRVMLFEPQPAEWFGVCAQRLYPLITKLQYLKALGVQEVLMLRFDAATARQSAEQFLLQLESMWRVRAIVVGRDCRFGARRVGHAGRLRRWGRAQGVPVWVQPDTLHDRVRCSSTRIRNLLQHGQCQKAAACLGRPYGIQGRVVHGAHRGRSLGFPTLNVPLRFIPPVRGVFGVQVRGLSDQALQGVANVGTRPTWGGEARLWLEVHVLNWSGDAYGQRVEVDFIHKIRDEQRFDSVEALQKQIRQDIQRACSGGRKDPP